VPAPYGARGNGVNKQNESRFVIDGQDDGSRIAKIMRPLLRVSRKPSADGDADPDAFPFFLPAIRTLSTLDLSAPITLFAGDNGTGKSTLLEALAISAEVYAIGMDAPADDPTLAPQQALARTLRLAWSRRTRRGFFMRSEDAFGYVRRSARDDARIAREKSEARGVATPELTASGALHLDEQYIPDWLAKYDTRSHGESYMDIFTTKVHAGGVYILDEPEAPLSPERQIELVRLILRASKNDAQFVIATHSPILLACPGAQIYSFDQTPIAAASYDDVKSVRLVRSFMADPEGHFQKEDFR
jgi:predicted ATPase